MLIRLTLLLTLISLSLGCHLSAVSPSGELTKNLARVRINSTTGVTTPVPLRDGLTVLNFFDEFSSGCPTGDRFETMERLHSLRPAATMLLIFSEKHFSTQDMDNFKVILPMSESLVHGDIEAIRPHLMLGKLLVVLDSKGSVIWHEKPDMSEQQVMSELSELSH
jgi:hypothetical protein